MKNKIIILFLAIIITFTYGNFAEASVVIKEADINNSNSKINTNKINENIYSKIIVITLTITLNLKI